MRSSKGSIRARRRHKIRVPMSQAAERSAQADNGHRARLVLSGRLRPSARPRSVRSEHEPDVSLVRGGGQVFGLREQKRGPTCQTFPTSVSALPFGTPSSGQWFILAFVFSYRCGTAPELHRIPSRESPKARLLNPLTQRPDNILWFMCSGQPICWGIGQRRPDSCPLNSKSARGAPARGPEAALPEFGFA